MARVAVRRCCGKLVEILYTQIIVAIVACACFTIYRSTQVISATTGPSQVVDNGPLGALSVEARLRQEALDRLAKEAKQYEDDDAVKKSPFLTTKKPPVKAAADAKPAAKKTKTTASEKGPPITSKQSTQKEKPSSTAKKADDNAKKPTQTDKKADDKAKKPTQTDKKASSTKQTDDKDEKEKAAKKPQSSTGAKKVKLPDNLLVQEDDFVYQKLPGEAAPIVLEEFKLIFFAQAKVGCTVFKMCFRRMMGFEDWKDNSFGMPHVPERNGLKYLYHYNRTYASKIIQDPAWTKAIFVRDPKERFLSAYLDKAVEEMLFVDTCCNRYRKIHCDPTPANMTDFLTAIHTCRDSHWDPQITRMEEKYWPFINFVGHLETAQEDAKRLLAKLRAWEQYGMTGWGSTGKQPMFGSEDGLFHSNNAFSKVEEYLHPELEQKVEAFYQKDYENPLFQFKHTAKSTKDAAKSTKAKAQKRPFVEPRDWIYRKAKKQGEAAPVVIEKYKLVFFVVPHVADFEFKQLLRRMMGKKDWRTQNYSRKKDFEKFNEGLVFLHDYNLTYASHIMTSPDWTRAIFTRDPKERFVLSYTQTAVADRHLLNSICCFKMPRLFCFKPKEKGVKAPPDIPSPTEFLEGIHTCKSTHWDPQTERLSAVYRLGISVAQKKAFDKFYFIKNKYWKYINFVGSMDSPAQDAKAMLERVGAWSKFGESGWGDAHTNDDASGHDSIFTSTSFQKEELKLKKQLTTVIGSPEMEQKVEELYASDYANPHFNLNKKLLYSLEGSTFRDEAKAMEAQQKGDTGLLKREW